MISHNIKIIEKPEWISWDDIHQCLWESHASNRSNGMTMKTSLLSGEELVQRIESKSINYKTFVALDGERLVGTGTVSIQNKRFWCVNGKVAYLMLAGVIPEYSGQGIYKQLYTCIEKEGANNGCELIYLDTAEGNERMQKLHSKQGFKYISFFASPSNHYSVIMAKWYTKQPYSDLYISLRYNIIKLKVMLKYKRGHIKRFPF